MTFEERAAYQKEQQKLAKRLREEANNLERDAERQANEKALYEQLNKVPTFGETVSR